MTNTCELCLASFSRSTDLKRHYQTDVHLTVKRAVDNAMAVKDLEMIEKDAKIAELSRINQPNAELMVENNFLREQLAKTERLVEKVALKATTVNNIKNTKTTNNLAYISSEPIKFEAFSRELPKLVTVEALMTNDSKFNGMISEALLQDAKGNNKMVCTDMARKQFQYKDETSGELVSDPYLERLRERMRSGVNYRQLYSEVLEHLDSMGGDISDNPSAATRILKRAKFSDKFVSHMAKRTYKGAVLQFEDDPSLE